MLIKITRKINSFLIPLLRRKYKAGGNSHFKRSKLDNFVILWIPGLRRGPRRALRPLSSGPSRRCRRCRCGSRRGESCYGVNLMRSKFVEWIRFALLLCCSLLPSSFLPSLPYALLERQGSSVSQFSSQSTKFQISN